MQVATLEPKKGENNGGEHHELNFKIDECGYLTVQVTAMCYGTHSTNFSFLMPCIGPEQLETFAKNLFKLAETQRLKDAAADK